MLADLPPSDDYSRPMRKMLQHALELQVSLRGMHAVHCMHVLQQL